ncbi:hypothetical protein PHAVU_009G017600 [Phaseolus vulgaris]|uniref:RING-type E3 ubiquitin transferase n=1 Tax=Phaseolus vulgaris TaxID=3885 RepID=V7AV32_PHAVU|nr:hypothetical protein PHAVU_009G017600g [Phaseolus vulgaris]ESW08091.1 hypothetical protein PHAVU_009G017600g [Phaseolus vulgaris]
METVEIVHSYHCEMRTEEVGVKIKLRDILRIDVTIIVRYYNHHLSVIETSTLLKSSTPISYQNFFENSIDFLRSVLFDPRCSYCFSQEMVDPVSEKIVNMIKVVLEFGDGPESVDSECKELPLNIDIIVDVVPDVESEEEEEGEEIEEEEMEHYAVTIPASAEAIDSLKTFSISPFLKKKTHKCNICLENVRFKDNEENMKLSSLPCKHVFHHLCIVKWLQTSHTCPLCRYPMPIDNN